MNTSSIHRVILRFTVLLVFMLASSCGPIVVTSRQGPPPPPWFYPNRVEVVRYVYFPELYLYFDLRTHSYLYLDGGVWVRRNQLPPRYQNYNLSRQRYERIRGYEKDNIREYHQNRRKNTGRSNRDYRSNRTPK